MSRNQAHYTIPVFIPMQGCRYACHFCNQNAITGKVLPPEEDNIIRTIEEHLSSFRKDAYVELAFFGGSFTGLPKHHIIHYLKIVAPYLQNNSIRALRVSTRPDYITKEILNILMEYGVKTIELGAQSMNDEVLLKSGRGHSSNDTIKASQLILENGFTLGLQMMTGLPADTDEKSLETANSFVALGAMETRIYPTLILKGTVLEQMYLSGAYKPQTTEQAVSLIAKLIPIFNAGKVKLLRIGLHTDENCKREHIIAGPDQKNIREKAMSELWNKKLSNIPAHLDKTIIIKANSSQINTASGYRKQNRKMLENKFKQVRFEKDDNLNEHEFQYYFI
jgi:histone acetyltransferase (RNA polymerase elongator complex component)